MLDYGDDAFGWFNDYVLPGFMGNKALSEEAGKEWAETTYMNKVVKQVEKRLQSHGKPFIAGTDKPTIADFKLFSPPSNVLFNQGTIIPASVQ